MKFKKGDIVMWKRGEAFDRHKWKIVGVKPSVSGIWDYTASNFESKFESTCGFNEHELVEEDKARLLVLAGKVQLSEDDRKSEAWLCLQGRKEKY